ncbi:intracellular serine protease [hydrocarbon metagenome]|uniref:Intracellular serine protease n=1 Tax=hydrocarbon metagenome TaxID=938273 RepID=A0A0W8E7R5_9ZZZZ
MAIIDTGIDYTHPDLKANVIGGISFVPGESDHMDLNGHGTHVAGIIAANGALLGVAPQSKLLAVKVLSKDGFGSYADIVQGLKWTRSWTGPAGEKVNVVNMSLGGPFPNTSMHQEVIKLVEAGITVVCAAGNSGDADPETREISYPAYYQESLAVGAVDLKTGIADFSNSNDRIDIVAPGVDTYSTYPGGKYVKFSGTSMAAPHLTGAVALIYSRALQRFGNYPSPAELKNLLTYQAIDLGSAGFDTLYGYGMFSFNIDGGKAITVIVGERVYTINNKEYIFEKPPITFDNVVYAPLEEICELMAVDSSYVAPDDSSGYPAGAVEVWS